MLHISETRFYLDSEFWLHSAELFEYMDKLKEEERKLNERGLTIEHINKKEVKESGKIYYRINRKES